MAHGAACKTEYFEGMLMGSVFSFIHRHARGARCVILLAGMAAVAVDLEAQTALQPGEELTYSVRWAVLPTAGQIRIAAAETEAGGTPQLNITMHTETRGLARSLMAFQADSESTFDRQSGRLVALRESSVARAKRSDYSLRFDYESRQALFTGQSAAARAIELPDGDPADLITTLMKTRLWDIRPGESRDVLVSFRDDFYELTIHARRVETVKTPLGSFETLVLEPRMEKTPPKGMFKRGGNVRVWVSRDSARLPVKFEVEMKVGTGVATLVKYTPPATSSESRVVADE
jgi:hypothetical protein